MRIELLSCPNSSLIRIFEVHCDLGSYRAHWPNDVLGERMRPVTNGRDRRHGLGAIFRIVRCIDRCGDIGFSFPRTGERPVVLSQVIWTKELIGKASF